METVLLRKGIKPTASVSTLLFLAWEHGTGKGCVLGLISTDASSGQRGLLGLEEYAVRCPVLVPSSRLSRSGLLVAVVGNRVLS